MKTKKNKKNNPKKPKTHTIVVFPNGKTWNTVEGCSIIKISAEQFDLLCTDWIYAGECKRNAIREIDLAELAQRW